MIREKFLKLITNDFEGDSEFLAERLPHLLNQAESKIQAILGSTVYVSFKKNLPQTISAIADNGDGTIKLTIVDASKFNDDDFVFYVINADDDGNVTEFRESTIVADTDETLNKIDVYGSTFTLESGKTYKVMNKLYHDIATAHAYMCAYFGVLTLAKMTQEGAGVNSLVYGSGSKTFSTMEDQKKKMAEYYKQASDLLNQHTDDDTSSPTFKMEFI